MADDKSTRLISPEQFEVNQRLEGIFLPHARRQRDEAYAAQNEKSVAREDAVLRFAHYTSAEAALGIIKTKRLWMRNARCMADYREVQHGFDIFNRFFSDPAKKDRFIHAIDDLIQGAATDAIRAFNDRWNNVLLGTYIASVSEHYQTEDRHGRLSMWRGFGGNARVAIVFRVPWFSGVSGVLNMMFSPVAYLREDQVEEVLEQVIGNVGRNREFLGGCGRQVVVDWLFTMLLTGVTCSKHEGFNEEKEWRAIYSPGWRGSDLMEHSMELVGGIPQMIHKIPLDERVSADLTNLEFSRIFDRLVIGPSQYPWPMFEAFAHALTSAGVPNASERLHVSEIPIRT